jgi:hypothetical protein
MFAVTAWGELDGVDAFALTSGVTSIALLVSSKLFVVGTYSKYHCIADPKGDTVPFNVAVVGATLVGGTVVTRGSFSSIAAVMTDAS